MIHPLCSGVHIYSGIFLIKITHDFRVNGLSDNTLLFRITAVKERSLEIDITSIEKVNANEED